MIPYSRQYISNKDKKNVLKALGSDFLTTGPFVKSFEKKLARKFNCKYAIVVNSATSALHLSCIALDLKPNDHFWTSPISFVSSSNCALLCNAKVNFVDIDANTFNLSVEKLEQKLLSIKRKSNLPKIVVPVHLAGNPVNLKKLKKLAIKYNFKIIEDASHATGSKLGKDYIGSCKYSNAAVFSFHPVKTITSGEGGAILTNSKKLFERVKILRNQGIAKKNLMIKNHGINPWHYEISSLGFNYRLTDIQAALGQSQLDSIDKFIYKRNNIAQYYKKKLSKKIKFQLIEKNNTSTYHLFIIKVNSKLRNKIVAKLHANNIYTNLHYIPIYRHKYYKQKYDFPFNKFPESEKYFKEAISIPVFFKLIKKDQDKIIKIINSFFQ